MTRDCAEEKAMIRDLVDLEVAFLKGLSNTSRKMMNQLDENETFKINHHLHVPRIALVLLRIVPSMIADYNSWKSFGKNFHESVDRLWSERYQAYLSEKGFCFNFLPLDAPRKVIGKGRLHNKIGGCLVFKDAKTPVVEALHTETLLTADVVAKCSGYPSQDFCDCRRPTCEKMFHKLSNMNFFRRTVY
mmetsp:Transcript_39047/g.117354  ORF Transcript_39047/g.117354 Transcript_39047/m.117354 type:complete len:189 (-) Transcript_39047:392-958(-)